MRRALLVMSSIFSLTSVATAQALLDSVEVVGTREPAVLSRSAADIVVIDAPRIRASRADSVEDLIRREAGMQLARNGGPGQNVGFFIRGASTNSTVVLIDGVRVGSATLGQAEFESLGLAQIERIEVLRGPASSLYGADAVGGVVLIFTRRGEGPVRVNGAAALGGYRAREASVGVDGSGAGVDYAASLSRESSRGVSALSPGDALGAFNPDRDGYQRNAGSVRLGYTPAAGHRIGLSALQTHLNARYDGTEAPTYDDPSPDFRNRLTTRVLSLDYRGALTSAWTTSAQLSRSVDDLASGGLLSSRFVTRREQATWQNAVRLGVDQQLVVAYERLNERAEADVFATAPKRHNDAVVVGYSGRLAAHSVQADLRRDDNSAYGADTTGRVAYAYDVGAGIKLRGVAGTTFRAPTFNDLAYPGYGVAGIQPEKGRSVEAGVSWQNDSASVSATVYRNRVRNLIGYQPDRTLCPPDPVYNFGCADNVSRARLQGLTLAAASRWGAFSARGNVDLLDAIDTTTGDRLTRRAAHQESVSVDYDPADWRFGASGLFVGARPDGGERLGGYFTLDLRAAWRVQPHWQIEARLLNALDRRIEPVLDYRALGRQAWLGVRYDGAGL